MDVYFWVEEIYKLYKEGMSLKDAINLVQNIFLGQAKVSAGGLKYRQVSIKI